MPMLHETIATELETCQIQDQNFELGFPSQNGKQSISQKSPLADITNARKSGVQHQSTNSYQKKITRFD